MSRPQGEVSGVVAVRPQDHYRDPGAEGGARLPGRGRGGDGEVLLEVRAGERGRGRERGSGLIHGLDAGKHVVQEPRPLIPDNNFRIKLKALQQSLSVCF